MNIFEKLSSIQAELKAPKNQKNTFGGYNYRSCEDILEAVKPICKKHNTALILADEIVLIGARYYVKATATLYDTEKADGVISATAYAREEEAKKGMDGSQVTGASSSYARKYALNGLFNIDDTKDSDATNTGDSAPHGVYKPHKPEAPRPQESKEQEITPEQALNYTIKSGKYAGKTLNDMSTEYLEWCVKNLSGKLAQMAEIVLSLRDTVPDDNTDDGLPF